MNSEGEIMLFVWLLLSVAIAALTIMLLKYFVYLLHYHAETVDD